MKQKCDICTKECFTGNLAKDYATDDIKQVCSDCLLILNKHKRDLQKMLFAVNHNFIEKLMYEMKNKYKSN